MYNSRCLRRKRDLSISRSTFRIIALDSEESSKGSPSRSRHKRQSGERSDTTTSSEDSRMMVCQKRRPQALQTESSLLGFNLSSPLLSRRHGGPDPPSVESSAH